MSMYLVGAHGLFCRCASCEDLRRYREEQREWERLTRPDCVWNYEPRRDVPDVPDVPDAPPSAAS